MFCMLVCCTVLYFIIPGDISCLAVSPLVWAPYTEWLFCPPEGKGSTVHREHVTGVFPARSVSATWSRAIAKGVFMFALKLLCHSYLPVTGKYTVLVGAQSQLLCREPFKLQSQDRDLKSQPQGCHQGKSRSLWCPLCEFGAQWGSFNTCYPESLKTYWKIHSEHWTPLSFDKTDEDIKIWICITRFLLLISEKQSYKRLYEDREKKD